MFHSSLSLLSVEVEGRSYGGGILKLEPSEMARVRVAVPPLESGLRQALIDLADRELRQQGYDEVIREIDRTVLRGILDLSRYTVSLLCSARLESGSWSVGGDGLGGGRANERLGEGDYRAGRVTRGHGPDRARAGEEELHRFTSDSVLRSPPRIFPGQFHLRTSPLSVPPLRLAPRW
jgi:hypothetical protein